MQTIGERLEDARKRKGISLREAAEATKIRSDFLGSIEQNRFDFDLPEIYKRGFLKNYARYLKLNVEQILTDYNAQQLSNSRLAKKAGAEWFGQMELKKADRPEHSEKSEQAETSYESAESTEREDGESAPLGRILPKPAAKPKEESSHEDEESDKTFYLKIGLIFVGTIALVFVVVGLIWAILGSGDSSTGTAAPAPEIRDTPSITETLTTGADDEPASSDSITLIASGNVYVLVKQKDDNQELYRNTMGAGDTVPLEKSGPVDILFTAGEFLTIEHGGERMRPSSSGTAKITIP
jgi:transcriptional regulator with XRE-family HTH domain